MNNGKLIWILLGWFCCIPLQAMEKFDGEDLSDRMVYIYNKSAYPVRISVGQNYPSSIALDPGQVIDFPLYKVEMIDASSYGKYTHFLSGWVARLNFNDLLRENKDITRNDHVITITYEKGASDGLLSIVKYLFTQGQWSLSLEAFDPNKHVFDSDDNNDYVNSLYESIKASSHSITDQIAKDAALVWSMFPRVAAKVASNSSIYPFNILSIDIGGFIASNEQLRNWGDLLYTSLKKRFSHIEDKAIWNAVNMLIADAIESLRERKYYIDRDPNYLVSLLRRSADVNDECETLPIELITRLKHQVKDQSAQDLLSQLEAAASKNKVASPPPAPPIPPQEKMIAKSYKEKDVEGFLKMFKSKRPEEQTLLDKVATSVFSLIEGIAANKVEHENDKNTRINLKYSALDELKLIEQHKHGIRQLNQVNEFINSDMITMVQAEEKPSLAMKDWIKRLATCKRSDAYDYSQLDVPLLQERVKKEDKNRDHQLALMSHLQEQIAKFQEPE